MKRKNGASPEGFKPGGALARELRFATSGSYNAETRTVDGVFASGAPVRRFGFVETLNMDAGAVDLSRVTQGQCKVLDSHNAFGIDSILGVVETASLQNGQLVGRIRFADTDAGRKAEGMVARGELTGFSIGYSIQKWTNVSQDENGVETWRADQWSLLEVTLCAVPADPASSVRAAAQVEGSPGISENEDNMTRSTQQEAAVVASDPTPAVEAVVETRAAPVAEAPASPAPAVDPAPAARAADLTAADIRGLQRLADIAGGNCRAKVDEWIDAGMARSAIFENLTQLAGARQQSITEIVRPNAQVTRDEGDTLRRSIEAAITHRANPQAFDRSSEEGRTSIEMANSWRGQDTILSLFGAYVEQTQGKSLRGLSKMERATLALGLNDPGVMYRAGIGTSDFSNILANVASKRLRDAYSSAPQAWRMLGRQSNSPDFKPKSVVALSGLPTFQKVLEGDEFTYGKFADGAESYSLATYGRIVAITRQALINDDLGAFDRIPTIIGRAAAELENSVVWGIFSTNAALADGVALFHSTHANLGTAGEVSETTLAEAERLMLEQLDASGQPFSGLIPQYLVVTPKRKVAAQKLLTAVQATATSGVNTFANRMQLIVEPRLKPASGTEPWFVIGDPNVLDTFEYAYLDGQEGVYTEQRVGFEIDGLEIKGRLDFAAKAIDYRNMVKNAGN